MTAPGQELKFRPGFRPEFRGPAPAPRNQGPRGPRPQAFIPHIPFDFFMSPDSFPMAVDPECEAARDLHLEECLIQKNDELLPTETLCRELALLANRVCSALEELIVNPGEGEPNSLLYFTFAIQRLSWNRRRKSCWKLQERNDVEWLGDGRCRRATEIFADSRGRPATFSPRARRNACHRRIHTRLNKTLRENFRRLKSPEQFPASTMTFFSLIFSHPSTKRNRIRNLVY